MTVSMAAAFPGLGFFSRKLYLVSKASRAIDNHLHLHSCPNTLSAEPIAEFRSTIDQRRKSIHEQGSLIQTWAGPNFEVSRPLNAAR
jgi:hypothetical protein